MKRFQLSILMVMIWLSAFSQSPSRIISLRPAYPLVIGESAIDGVVFVNNALCMTDTPLDSLSHLEIGQIFTQTVRYTESGHGFYVKADSLRPLNVTYSYEINEAPQGTIEFNELTGRFKYYPAIDDYKSFIVTFTATNGTESVSEDVEFNLMPKTPSEANAFYSKGTMPDAGDYTIIAEASKDMNLNNQNRTAYSISISGKDVIFDNTVQNKVWGLSGREDIYELNIYAERLIVRSALSFPQTNVAVYAKELVFEDTTEEFASINTTPSSIETLTNGKGENGASAGDISLYVKEFKGNMAIRLIANGAKGQSTNRNGTPGNGGDGGTITSTVDVSSYCDYVRGKGGVKYDVAEDGSSTTGPIMEFGAIGSPGRFVLKNKPNAYLHPYFISAVMRHATDAFINNETEYVLQTCREYRTVIDEYLNTVSIDNNDDGNHEGTVDLGDLSGSRRASGDIFDLLTDDNEEDYPEYKLELRNDLLEINKMLFRLEQGLDYFGNPAGWTPLLSFEAYFKSYDNEIDRAIPTLYMYYWLSRIDKTLQNMVKASEFAANTTIEEIGANKEMLNALTLELPVLEDEAAEVERMIDELTQRIIILQNQLMAQATKNVKRQNWIKKLFNIATSVVSVIPAVGPVATAVNVVSNAIKVAESVGPLLNQNWDFSELKNVLKNVGTNAIDFKQMTSDVKTAVNGISLNAIGNNPSLLITTFNSINKSTETLTKKVKEVYDIITKNTAPSDKIQEEYNKLIANSPEWNSMVAQIEELNNKKVELVNHMNQLFSDMTTTVSEISNNILALDAFRRDAFTGNSKRDLNAMIYMEKMKQRAKDRLMLYDYYLRKAYEYRLLKPYDGEEFNLVGMFDRYEKLGLALDSVVDVAAYDKLATVFREHISEMTTRIVNEYTYSHPERSSKRSYGIPKQKIDVINANGSVILNLYEMGFFNPNEENIRIVDFGVRYIKAHADGNPGYWGEMNLEMSHSGVSKFRKDGNIYWFNHMSTKTKNPHLWNTKIDINDLPEVSNPETDKNTVAISSLLSTILNNNTENIMLFSRPSVWSDITMSKVVYTENNCDIVIDSLVLEIQYDYTRRTVDNCNIDINANNELLPYIACSEEDVSGRSSGKGHLYRSYRKSSQQVTFTATDKYETYYFVNWTDKSGNVVSNKQDLTVNRSKDQFYIANYERRVPILSVSDTIRVSNDGGTYVVNITNIGSGDTEMDWYVSDSLCTWVRLNGVAEGIDNGVFTITCKKNTTGQPRIDSLKIFVPETDIMSKVIYVVQKNEGTPILLNGDVNADGSVDIGDIVMVISVMTGTETDTAIVARADVNNDGAADIGDIVSIISIMTGQPAGARANATARIWQQENSDRVSMTMEDNALHLSLDNSRDYTAFQFQLTLPEGTSPDDMTISSLRGQGHVATVEPMGNGQYLVMGYSLGNKAFNGYNGELLTLNLKGQQTDQVAIYNVIFADAKGQTYRLMGGETTGVGQIDNGKLKMDNSVYDLQGRKVTIGKNGIYLVGNKKVVK